MVQQTDLRSMLAVGRNALDATRVPAVAALVQAQPRKAPRLLELLWDDDPGVASRAADVLERISRDPSPAMCRALANFKEALLGLLSDARFIKLRWNLALTIARLPLTQAEARRAAAVLHTYLEDKSSIVKTGALQGMTDLARHDPASLPAVLDLLRIHGRSGTPAMRARSRLLLAKLEKPRKTAPK
jgi:hypothetical protein